MHYWMLVFRHQFSDGGFFDIAIPTCYYNYEQFVTSAHIDFEMSDVSEISAKLAPLHNMITNQIMSSSFPQALSDLFQLQFEPLSVDVGTLHRHPGSSHSQRFSGTDLDANSTNHGIVFPLKSGINKPSFSGILAIDAGECNVAHYEYRLVNGSYDTSDLSYVKGRCIALTLNDTYVPPVISDLEKFFGASTPSVPYKTKSDSSLLSQDQIEQLTSLINLLPVPNTQCIRPENVKLKKHSFPNYITPHEPYKLDLDRVEYGHSILAANLIRHYEFHNLPYVKTAIYSLSVPDLKADLIRLYNYKAPTTKPVPDEPPSSFSVCTIPVWTDAELALAPESKLIEHLDALDTYYYGKPSPSIIESEPDITREELIDYILELYVNIYDEEQEALNVKSTDFFEYDFIG